MGLQRTDSFGGTTLLPPKLNTLESEGRVALSGPGCGEAGTEDCYQNGKKKKVSLSVAGLLCCPGGSDYEGSKTSSSATVFSCDFDNGLNYLPLLWSRSGVTLSLRCACLVTTTRSPPGCTSSHE